VLPFLLIIYFEVMFLISSFFISKLSISFSNILIALHWLLNLDSLSFLAFTSESGERIDYRNNAYHISLIKLNFLFDSFSKFWKMTEKIKLTFSNASAQVNRSMQRGTVINDMYWNGKGLFFTEKQNSAIEGKIKCLNKLLTWPYHIHWQDFVPWIKIIIHENNMLLRFIGKRNRRMAHNYLAGVFSFKGGGMEKLGKIKGNDEFLKADDVTSMTTNQWHNNFV
ncbi:hypothetical protein ACJX0J_038178, partial [Zea mays]